MRIIRGLRPEIVGRPLPSGCVLTIGNFDGVHRGHQQLIDRIQQASAVLHLPASVMIFEPMPREFFHHEQAPPRIASLREKLEDLRNAGVAQLCLLRFDAALAQLGHESFAQWLLETVNARHLVLGHDFHFGAGRGGDYAWLRGFSEARGVTVEQCAAYTHAGERVSSTLIRQLLAQGSVQIASGFLGRPYRISGRVARGQQLARQLGMPTVNLVQRIRRALRRGVYAVRVQLPSGVWRAGVASFGVRPTVDGIGEWLEVHLFDFAADLYGQRLTVEFVTFLRDEVRLDSLEALRAQMQRDAVQAREVLNG